MPTPAIALDRVTFKYKGNSTFAIRNVTLDIEEGDFLLLMGYSGSGKSTLLKTINGLIPNFHAGSFGGSVKIFGKSIENMEVARLANKVGFVFQNPENQLSALNVEQEIAFPMENFGIPRENMIKRIDELIELLNLDFIRFNSPFSISGGEQQLVAIAAALALDPDILILDEVTAHLSPTSAKLILEILAKINKQFNKTIIISEHRLDRCIKYANKLAYIEDGRLKIADSVNNALSHKAYPTDLLPQIPRIFLTLKDKTSNFESCNPRAKNILSNTTIPLCTEDLLKILKEVQI